MHIQILLYFCNNPIKSHLLFSPTFYYFKYSLAFSCQTATLLPTQAIWLKNVQTNENLHAGEPLMFFSIDMVPLFFCLLVFPKGHQICIYRIFLLGQKKHCILAVRMAAIQMLNFFNDNLLHITVALRSEKCLDKSSGRCITEILVYQKPQCSHTLGGLSSCLHSNVHRKSLSCS